MGVGLAVLVLAAAAAGIVNTMAGGGSLLVIPVLIALGLPPSTANGTLRVGVLVQNVSSLVTFHRRGVRQYALVGKLAVPMLVGAAAGTGLATRVPDDLLEPVFGGLLVVWAVILLFRPGRFIAPPEEPSPVKWTTLVGALAVGFYGGFIQAGVGFPLLLLLVSHLGVDPVRANGTKVALVLAYTLVSLPMFALAGQVAWLEGGALAVGASLGGWLGTRWQVKSGAGLVRWFVVVTVAISGSVMVYRAL
jgi:uncharacterized membrane protein YfcA